MTSSILIGVDKGVATLTLNRPKAMNAFDAETARALVDLLETFANDDGVRVLVVAGNGTAFSAGGDFNSVLTWPELNSIERGAAAGALMGAIQAIRDFPKPWIPYLVL